MNLSVSKTFELPYQAPYAWPQLFRFLQARVIDGLEAITQDIDGGDCYSRTIQYRDTRGYFTVKNAPEKRALIVCIYLNQDKYCDELIQRLKLVLDVNAPINQIDQQLQGCFGNAIDYQLGLRVPGLWGYFEAGVRAILGQQVSIIAARNLVQAFVENLGEKIELKESQLRYFFPRPEAIVESELDFFKMPQARKDCLRALASHFLTADNPRDVDAWIDIKGIGPWTINYVKMRAVKDPDVWLLGDAGLKNALKTLSTPLDIELLKPWRSYATFQLWNQL